MVKDDDCRSVDDHGTTWYPYNFICHGVWAQIVGAKGIIHLEEAIAYLHSHPHVFREWPGEPPQLRHDER